MSWLNIWPQLRTWPYNLLSVATLSLCPTLGWGRWGGWHSCAQGAHTHSSNKQTRKKTCWKELILQGWVSKHKVTLSSAVDTRLWHVFNQMSTAVSSSCNFPTASPQASFTTDHYCPQMEQNMIKAFHFQLASQTDHLYSVCLHLLFCWFQD